MNRRNPNRRRAPGRNSRSVMALAADSASACSWRRRETALELSDWRIRAPSVPASSRSSRARPTRERRSRHRVDPGPPMGIVRRPVPWTELAIRVAAQSSLTRDAANRAPSMPTPPAKLRTTRSTKDPMTIRKWRRRSRGPADSRRREGRPPRRSDHRDQDRPAPGSSGARASPARRPTGREEPAARLRTTTRTLKPVPPVTRR